MGDELSSFDLIVALSPASQIEAEKITKYRDLEIEIQKGWNLKKIKTIPIVIGALGTVCKGINDYLKTISPNIEFRIVQKTALLGTAYILRNFLTPLKNSKPSGTA